MKEEKRETRVDTSWKA